MSMIILLTALLTVCYCEGRYQELPLVDTAGCPKVKPQCDAQTKYRTYDGSCSNLEKPNAAAAGEPFVRFSPAQYADGISQPRQSVKGGPLPPARLLVTSLFPDHDVPDHINTLNVMQFGQNLAEDSSQKRDRRDKNGDIIPCCTADFKMLPAAEMSKDCWPVQVSPSDFFYKAYHVTCQTFVQCINNNTDTCWQTPVEKGNFVSHVLDVHGNYGTNKDVARGMRTLDGGKLVVQLVLGKPFLPLTDKLRRECPIDKAPENETFCFAGGDLRVNTNSGLTLNTITQRRLHNILCDRLAVINPHWEDETLFQEARRILGAVWQHVTYKHFLPNILGTDFMRKKGLLIDNYEKCCINHHDPKFNPSVAVEFNMVWRTFHTLVPRQMHFIDENWKVYRKANIDDFMMRSSLFKEAGVVDGLLRGLAGQQSQEFDTYMSTSMKEHLFKKNLPHGWDLFSFDVQRSQEFGVATYNVIRPLCGLKKATTFQDLSDVMSQDSIGKLSKIYKHVDDIDLYVGVLFEKHVAGAMTGPTAQCIVGEQFLNFMKGDRFHYENCNQPWSFSKAQLAALYKTSLSWVWCEVGDNITTLPRNTFHAISPSNPVVPCSQIPSLDLSAWKEEKKGEC